MPSKDFILPISFNTAQEIGLEESVLIAFLEQHAFMYSSRVLNFDMSSLSAHLPFWTGPMLQRILSSLQVHQLLSFERHGGQLTINLDSQQVVRESGERLADSYQTNSPSFVENTQNDEDELVNKLGRLQRQAKSQEQVPPNHSSTLKNRKNLAASHMHFSQKQEQASYNATHEALPKVTHNSWSGAQKTKEDKRRGVSDFDLYLEQKERTRQPDQWLPEESTLEQISQAGIQRQFASQLLPEFLLRIKEQRKNVRTWNSEFFKYVKRQWQYKQSDRSSYEGTQSSSYSSRTSKEQVSDALTNIHDTDW